jgi:hypothetical protein
LTGAAITVLALAEPFIAAGAAVAFWFFFATEKELSPRGYERNEMIKCLVGNTKHKKICFCLWQRVFVSFVLKQKAPKVQEKTMLPPHRAKHLARRSFIPPHGYCSSFNIYSF